MTTLNLASGASSVFSGRFLTQVGLAFAGGMSAMVLTDWAQNNVFDVSMKGGDALYPVIGMVGAMSVLPRRYGRPLALGMGVSAAEVVVDDFNLL